MTIDVSHVTHAGLFAATSFTRHDRHEIELYVAGSALVYVLVILISIYLMARILHKAGYSGAWAILGLIPAINFIAFIVFAFLEWPVTKAARGNGGMTPIAAGGSGGTGGTAPPPAPAGGFSL